MSEPTSGARPGPSNIDLSKPPNRTRDLVIASLICVVGSVVVLGSVVVMNELSVAPDQDEVLGSTQIEVAAPTPKPKPKVRKPRPKPPPKPAAPPPPSVAALTSGNASMAVDIPGLAFDDLGGAAGDLLAGGEEAVHTGDTVDIAPQAVTQEPPAYPRRAQQQGQEGYVVLSLLINQTGGIERLRIIESSPPGVFDDAAKAAVRNWTFSPGSYQGKPVKVWVNQTLNFKLK